jgi:hypothetical protein
MLTWLQPPTSEKKEEKYKIEKSKADVCQEYGLLNSKIHKIWKHKTKVIGVLEQTRMRIK